MDIAVLGGGYVGVVTAACLADRGHHVTIHDVDGIRSERLAAGVVPFFEPGLAELFASVLATGHLTADPQADTALAGRDTVLICVGTPLGEDGEADLRQVRSACRMVKDHAGTTAAIVIRSTLPLGSSVNLGEWLGRPSLAGVAANPEFLRQGSAITDFQKPTRIVIGTADGRGSTADEAVRDLYTSIEAPILSTDFASAEMIKNASNAYLAMKLSFVNEIADLCEAYDADVDSVIEGMSLDPRIGGSYLRPGIGFGGSCLPKELANLLRLGRRRNLPMHMFDAASRSNDERANRIAQRVEVAIGRVEGRKLGQLGLSYKAGTDDTRYSPAVALARALLARGATVNAHDPQVPIAATSWLHGLSRARDPESAVTDSELVILATDWPEYRALDWRHLASVASSAVLLDGRNALDPVAMDAAGWLLLRVGRSDPSSPQRLASLAD
jgi:UDPglucose 6-dehydrogenase